MFTVTNSGKATCTFHDTRGKPIHAGPGSTLRDVNITERTAEQLRRGGLQVSGSDDYVATEQNLSSPTVKSGGVHVSSGSGGGGDVHVSSGSGGGGGVHVSSGSGGGSGGGNTGAGGAGGERTRGVGEEGTRGAGGATRSSSELIAAFESKQINFGEFQSEAKTLLGDKWPGGTPRKSVILELLGKS